MLNESEGSGLDAVYLCQEGNKNQKTDNPCECEYNQKLFVGALSAAMAFIFLTILLTFVFCVLR